MVKAFDTVWIDSLLYKLTLLNFLSYIVHTISSYIWGRTSEASFQMATLSLEGLICLVLFSLYINDMSSPSHHVELAPYADDTAIIATSPMPTVIGSYLES